MIDDLPPWSKQRQSQPHTPSKNSLLDVWRSYAWMEIQTTWSATAIADEQVAARETEIGREIEDPGTMR